MIRKKKFLFVSGCSSRGTSNQLCTHKPAVIFAAICVNSFIPTRHINISFQFITSAQCEDDLFIYLSKQKVDLCVIYFNNSFETNAQIVLTEMVKYTLKIRDVSTQPCCCGNIFLFLLFLWLLPGNVYLPQRKQSNPNFILAAGKITVFL